MRAVLHYVIVVHDFYGISLRNICTRDPRAYDRKFVPTASAPSI